MRTFSTRLQMLVRDLMTLKEEASVTLFNQKLRIQDLKDKEKASWKRMNQSKMRRIFRSLRLL